MKMFLVLLAVASTMAGAWSFSHGKVGKIASAILALVTILSGGYAFMSNKGIFVKQKDIKTDDNVGARVSNSPAEGAKLPSIHIEQERIDARSNIGLDFSFNPDSGPIKLDHTEVKNEHMSVRINPDFVTVNPGVADIKFLYEKKGN